MLPHAAQRASEGSARAKDLQLPEVTAGKFEDRAEARGV
jgi:hypothetical protein